MVYRTIRPLLRAQWLAYLLVSTVALASDTAAFLALLSAGLAPAQAGAAGYSFGIVAHWILSSRLVFARARRLAARRECGRKLSSSVPR